MPQYDMAHRELVGYRPNLEAPGDLGEFWHRTLDESRQLATGARYERVASGLVLVDTYDVTFGGFGGDPVRAWLHLPANARGPLPAVVTYQGYGAGRGLPHQVTPWVLAGYANLVVDTRGQGATGGWPGDTGDPIGAAPSHPGFMTRGILDPYDYYYRRVYTDAVLAIEALCQQPLVDQDNVVVSGGSQGGGIALATAALNRNLKGVMVDVPFLCDFQRATAIAASGAYLEIVGYLRAHREDNERVFATLAYFDGAVLAHLAKAPALFSVALMDQLCPPSTVYAAYNHYGGPKTMVEYPFDEHEGGEALQQARQLRWLAELLGRE